jgi:hypothetical protein
MKTGHELPLNSEKRLAMARSFMHCTSLAGASRGGGNDLPDFDYACAFSPAARFRVSLANASSSGVPG